MNVHDVKYEFQKKKNKPMKWVIGNDSFNKKFKTDKLGNSFTSDALKFLISIVISVT